MFSLPKATGFGINIPAHPEIWKYMRHMTIRLATSSLVLAISLLAGSIASAQAPVQISVELAGFFYGVDDATGASIEIQPDRDGFVGTFFDAQGNSQKFEADRNGETAEAVLDMDGRAVLLRVVPLPFGADVTIVPFDAAGNLVIGEGRQLNFVRAGLSLPKPGKETSIT